MNSEELVPVFIPALVALLVNFEDKKGSPLTQVEVIAIRDGAACIMMEPADSRKMDESRGYCDIDPENCWYDWQMTRREMGRLPEIDPGPRFDLFRSDDPEYQRTIQVARASIERFREMLPADGSPRPDALIKTRLEDGEFSVFMWLNNVAIAGVDFSAELFELPESMPSFEVGIRYPVKYDALVDWMVKENGRLYGGYSLRYHRSRLPDDKKADFDQNIGVTEYT